MDELELKEKESLQEDNEVVSWYVPQQGKEVVSYYVREEALPTVGEGTPRKKRRRGLWICLGAVALLAVVAVVGSVLFAAPKEAQTDAKTDGDASSIVDIFADSKLTTITRCHHDTDYLMDTVEDIPEEPLTSQEIYAKVNPATVLVASGVGDYASLGTGVIMTEDGYVLTNAHVITGGQDCMIVLDTGKSYECELVGYDEDRDVAVLHTVDAAGLPTVTFADSETCVVGDTVYAIGNPLGIELRGTFTEGILSAYNRPMEVDGHSLTVLQTTAALNNGNSGGPLINAYGQVIGINTLKMGAADAKVSVEGLGFALPTNEITYVVNAILKEGGYKGRPTLGITVKSVTDGTNIYLKVYEVAEGSDAQKQGIVPGDIITKADGETVSYSGDLLRLRNLHVPGETMDLTVMRAGETFTVSVKLDTGEK